MWDSQEQLAHICRKTLSDDITDIICLKRYEGLNVYVSSHLEHAITLENISSLSKQHHSVPVNTTAVFLPPHQIPEEQQHSLSSSDQNKTKINQ